MERKLPESFKKLLKEKELKLLNENEYKTYKNKMSFEDKDGYKYYCSFDVLSDKRTKSPAKIGKGNIYTIQNIQKFIENNGSKTKVISKEFNGLHGDIYCKCECGNIYRTEWNFISQSKKFYCNDCGIKRRAKTHVYGLEYISSICEEHGFKFIPEDYIDTRKVSIIDSNGYKHMTALNCIRQERKYRSDNFSKSNPYTVENMIHYIKANKIPCDIVDKTNRVIEIRKDNILFYCEECHKPFYAKWGQVAYEGRYRCEDCISFLSNLEYKVKEYLEEKNIDYVQQKKFKDCKNKRLLPFDFYLPKYECCIEVMGSQHYVQSEMFKQSITERKYIDKIKKDFCLKNNIKYLEIPFWDISNKWKTKRYKILIDNLTNT